MSREYLADEITMVQSDNLVLKQENELLRMTSERKNEENRLLKEEVTELRSFYAEKIDECAALRTILEGVGHNVSAGLTRFMERRRLRNERDQPKDPAAARAAVVKSYRAEQSSETQGHAAFAPPPKGTVREMEPATPAPSFLRNLGGRNAPQGPHDHELLPRVEETLSDIADAIGERTRR